MYMNHEESHKLYNEGRKLIDQGKLEEAVVLLKESNQLHAHFKTLELWGECEIKLGKSRQAIMPLTAATELNSGIKPMSLLAKAYQDIGEEKKAIELANKVLSKEPNNKLAKSILNEKNI